MKNRIYKFLVQEVTHHCYSHCLNYFPCNSHILDVGIGNGIMLKNFHSLIKSKNLKITGIDINKHYLNHCDCLIKKYQLDDYIQIHCKAVEDYHPGIEKKFDFILFSMSFMLFKNQQQVLVRAKSWIRPDGNIVFFQTVFNKKFRLMEFVKPKLKYITTIDFGKVTYEKDFFNSLEQQNLQVSEDRLIKKEWFRGEYRMITASIKKNIER